MSLQKPLLIFDGDCGFCRRWIERWKVITGEEVTYAPYQEVGAQFPEIPVSDCQQSVQLIEPLFDGQSLRRSSAAEAVFRSLSYNSSRKWMLNAYEKFPFVRKVTETFYGVVARNRRVFSFLTAFLWGRDVRPSTYRFSGFLFRRLLGLISAIAFLSLGSQICGLVGERGILPVADFLKKVTEAVPSTRFWNVPTLFWLNASDTTLVGVCWLGGLFSLCVFVGLLSNAALFLIWIFYLSLVSVGQDFLSFQWDILLLETVFLSIFFTPGLVWDKFRLYEPPALPRFLLKFLIFKLMFLSGAVKLGSGDPVWKSLTALYYHYETQPLPPWTAWYAHHLPHIFQKISVLLMFGIELFTPFLFFFPRRLRHFGALCCIGLQVLIMVTGNYCFFNLLSAALCLLLLDDSFWKKDRKVLPWKIPGFSKAILLPLAAVYLMVSISQMAWLWEGRQSRRTGVIEGMIRPFRTINSYGLFAVMTTQRFEIIMEGSDDRIDWKPYEFRYKPGDVSAVPQFVQPHQPRLDWQMWFAALGNFRQNPWIINLGVRLLQNEPQVLHLLKRNPFPEKPPKFVRGRIYRYHFSSPEKKKKDSVWWEREEMGLYSPEISIRD